MESNRVDLYKTTYWDLVEMLEASKGTFSNLVFYIGKTNYFLDGLECTSSQEGVDYKFNFATQEDTAFKRVYVSADQYPKPQRTKESFKNDLDAILEELNINR